MSCGFSRGALALHAEGDLPEADAAIASTHLVTCDACRTFLAELHARQSLLKSLRQETVVSSDCSAMRRDVMSIINERRRGYRSGWMWRVERAAVFGFQRRSFAVAAFVLAGVVSVSVLAQMRDNRPAATSSVAVFEGRDTLLRPEGYRNWILMDRSAAPRRSAVAGSATSGLRATGRIYINPSAYREQAKTGQFPEGTLMVWESAEASQSAGFPHKRSSLLLVAVKNSARFDEGWGSFDFTGPDGTLTAKAQALPEASGCRTCHRPGDGAEYLLTPFAPVS